ncbi:MAG: hypothetical protein GEV10_28660 [Streptosporangiales bacterium]|nr:hypothetical protein [Streptosporangiales bacterium]
MKRDVDVNGEIAVDYRLTAASPERFLHAVHILLDLSSEARIAAPEVTHARILDYPQTGVSTEVTWPNGLGMPLDQLGPNDGTATGACLLDCQHVTVLDQNDALALTWSTRRRADQRLLSMFLWRNLCGWPTDAPYRAIGIEPMVGRAADLGGANREDVAEVRNNHNFHWRLHITCWRRLTCLATARSGHG